MGTDVTQQEDPVRLSAGNEITIYTVSELKESLYKEWKQVDGATEVDLSEVDELDSAGIQLLLQMKADSERHCKPVHFVNHSSVVLENLELLNLISRFSDPVVIPADKTEASA